MTSYLLDTRVWFRYLTNPSQLPAQLKQLVDEQRDRCWLSPVSALELSAQAERGRVKLDSDLGTWLKTTRRRLPLKEAVLTTEIVVRSQRLEIAGGDAVDRLLAATAIELGLTLVTLDRHLLQVAGLATWSPSEAPPSVEPAPIEPEAPRPTAATMAREQVVAPPEEAARSPQVIAAAPSAPVAEPASIEPEITVPPQPEPRPASAFPRAVPPLRLAPPAPPEPAPERPAEAAHAELAAEPVDIRSVMRAIPQHPVATTHQDFRSLGLSEPILKSVERIGFTHPTPIQAAVIPPALAGHDIIGLAQTGSGKTAAFCLPLAERLTHGRGVRGLILSPTREIALQTQAFLEVFGQDHDLETVCLIGGVAMGPQIQGLRGEPDVVVATPGRLLDHLRRRNLKLDRLQELVFDEADHMLDLGFMPQIQEVLEFLPAKRRTMMFSATMPEAIERLARRLMAEPVRVDILPEGRAAEGISHRLYLVGVDDKKACLLALLHQELGSTLVFIRRKVDAEWLCRVLGNEGHPVERIHSDLSQGQRTDALQGFREGEHRILVATDIAARGLDIPRIQHIINFDLPETVEDYIHRAGRTARGKLLGTVSSIATWQDKMMIRDIEEALGKEIPRCTLPGVEPWEEMKTRPRGRHRLPMRRRV